MTEEEMNTMIVMVLVKSFKKIRENDPSWKSSPLVEQVDCVPIYEWDGKFYKDKASAKQVVLMKK